MSPRIQEYLPQTEPAGPAAQREASASDTGGVGLALESAGHEVERAGGMLMRYKAQQEVSDIQAQLSKLHADSTTGLDDTLQHADPGDDSVVDKFMEGFDNRTSDIGQGASTRIAQNYFNKASSVLRAHFVVAAAQGQAALASAKAQGDYAQSLNNYSSALINEPSAFSVTNETQTSAIDAMVEAGTLPAGKAPELKNHASSTLAEAAIRGWMKLDAPGTIKQLNDGQWDQYIPGNLKHQLLRESDMQIRADQAEKLRLQAQQDQIKAQQQTNTQNQFLGKMVSGQLSNQDILNSNLDPFGSGSKETFLKMNSEADKVRIDPAVVNNLYDRIHLPDGDPQKITDDRDLNVYFPKIGASNMTMLRKEIRGYGTEEGSTEQVMKQQIIAQAKATLTKSNPILAIKDPTGEANYTRWLGQFTHNFDAARQQGKSADALLNPSSPDYLGKSIDAFVLTPQQIIQSLSNSAKLPGGPLPPPGGQAPATPVPSAGAVAPAQNPNQPKQEPRRPGESAADYLKRISGH